MEKSLLITYALTQHNFSFSLLCLFVCPPPLSLRSWPQGLRALISGLFFILSRFITGWGNQPLQLNQLEPFICSGAHD